MTDQELKRIESGIPNIGHPSGRTPIFQDMRALVAEVRRLRAEMDRLGGAKRGRTYTRPEFHVEEEDS